jgi:hypothetical protein
MAAADEPAPRGTFKLTSSPPQRRAVLTHRHSYDRDHGANDGRRLVFSDCATRPRPSITFYLPVVPNMGRKLGRARATSRQPGARHAANA